MAPEPTVWNVAFSKLGVSSEEILRKINKHLTQRKAMHAAISRQVGINLSGKIIIEVGAGTAIECLLFALNGARTYAIDYEEKAMRYAHAVASLFAAGPHLNVGNGLILPVKDSCADFVLSQGFLEHFDPPEVRTLIAEQVRILKPGAHLLIDVPNFHSPYEIYKRIMFLVGHWIYGKEVGIKRGPMVSLANEYGLELVDSYGWSFRGYAYKSPVDFIFMLPLLAVRNLILPGGRCHDSFGLLFRKKPAA
jgi:SAM-dependent methyltransferase